MLRGLDLNQRPQGYGPCELPDCSTPRLYCTSIRQKINLCPTNHYISYSKTIETIEESIVSIVLRSSDFKANQSQLHLPPIGQKCGRLGYWNRRDVWFHFKILTFYQYFAIL